MRMLWATVLPLVMLTMGSAMAQPATPAPAAPAAANAPINPALLKQGKADIVLGKNSAPVTIIEYASLSCPHCAHFHNTVLPQLQKTYIDTGKVKLISRPFPLNAPALRAAMLTGCAGRDRYYTFMKVLFSTQDKWAFDENYLKNLATIAKVGGINQATFDKCMADKKLEDNILTIYKLGADELHVDSTPTFFVDGKRIAGAANIEEMSRAIDAALAGKPEKPQAK